MSGYTPYTWLQNPNFSGRLGFRVEQQKPDGSLWSATITIDDRDQTGSTQLFPTEQAARDWGYSQMR